MSGILFTRLLSLFQAEGVATAWEKAIQERKAALAQLPGLEPFPANATTWRDYAQHTFDELLIEDDCWFDEPDTGIRGFRPYVKGTDGWGGVLRIRTITELMAEMDVLWPMYRYLQLHPDPEAQAVVNEFIGELPKYYNASARQSTNRPGESGHDSWYFMENAVLKYGHLYLISGAQELREPYFGSLGSALDMAHNFDYLFPQFVSLEKEKASGYNTHNYSTAGLMAYSLVYAYELTRDVQYLKEAEQALLTMFAKAAPLNLIYEPQELAAAAAAAAHLNRYAAKLDSATNWAKLAQGFFYAETLMMYSEGGKSALPRFQPQRSDWLPETWRDGLFVPYYNPVESGGINAPAFKENLEAVIFWADYLRYLYGTPGFDPAEPLKVLNLNRIKNFYFFSPNIPDEWERDFGPTSLQYIPYEDIDYYGTRNGENGTVTKKAGFNGKEIYGAGEVLWAYLAFEAMGEAADRNALILNLNLFDRRYPPSLESRAYIVS